MTEPILCTEDLTVRFGGLLANDAIHIDCHQGELTGLIGPNGAGKTTFIDAVTGFLPRNASGSVKLCGREVMGQAPHQLARAGLRRTWQSLELFDDVSVRSNLEVASRQLTARRALTDYFVGSSHDRSVDETLELLDLAPVANRHPYELSHGQRRLVGLGRALVATATLLLLDEPAAGLDREETTWLGHRLRRVVDAGTAMLLVDHDMRLVLEVSDRVHVLEFGERIASDTPDNIRTNERVVAAYLGSAGAGG